MSSDQDPLDQKPLIALADKAAQVLGADIIRESRDRGHGLRLAHNAVFGHLPLEGGRASDIAARAGITKQSMGEVVRELVEMGLLEMTPDPSDRRAKLVTYTKHGRAVALDGKGYLATLERRFAEEFGEEKYAHAREVLEKVIESFAPE
jgi:DNA-binding MarR family transcriptional regulator